MWHIKEISGASIVEEVGSVLDTEKYGAGYPKGVEGEEAQCFCFYALKSRKNVFDEEEEYEEYITTQLTSKPVLTAVTKGQLETWQKQKIIVKPAVAIYLGWSPEEELLFRATKRLFKLE